MADDVSVEAAERPRLGRRGWIVASAAMLVFLVALAIGGAGLLEWRGLEGRADRDREVLETAAAVATSLVTVGGEDPRGDLDRILAGTTGELRRQFVEVADAFTVVLDQGAVTVTGEVPSIAILDVEDDRATVIAAVVSTVRNAEVPDGQRRAFRMELTLERLDDRWAVANMEVVS